VDVKAHRYLLKMFKLQRISYFRLASSLHKSAAVLCIFILPKTEGERMIKSYLSDFSYALYRDKFFSRDPLVAAFQTEEVPYFRLQIFRVLIGVLDLRSKFQDDPLLKYIDEQFHVENDYLFYLDLSKFDTVPSFVIESCEAFLRANSII
ncbi:MAG: hypothetical protein AB1767_13995, partial [Bacillota bacterium]